VTGVVRHRTAAWRRRVACATALVSLAGGVQAQEVKPVATDRPVTLGDTVIYGPAATALPAKCDWPQAFVQQVVGGARGHVVVGREAAGASAPPYLSIEVTQMDVDAGGHFSNKASWILIHGELRVDGRRVDGFDYRRSWRKAMGACAAARKIGDMLAADVVGWLAARSTTPVAPAR
jgi:hypothetical protein